MYEGRRIGATRTVMPAPPLSPSASSVVSAAPSTAWDLPVGGGGGGVGVSPSSLLSFADSNLSAEEQLALEKKRLKFQRKVQQLQAREEEARIQKEARKRDQEAEREQHAAQAFSPMKVQAVPPAASGGSANRSVASSSRSSGGKPVPSATSNAQAGLPKRRDSLTGAASAAAAAATVAAAAPKPAAKKAPVILKQPEGYGERYAQQHAAGKNAAAAPAPADPRSVGPSIEDLDAELQQLELDEARAIAQLAAEEKAKKAERTAARQSAAAAAAAAGPTSSASAAPSRDVGLNRPSNKALLTNAVTHVLLAGGPMAGLRESVLAELRASPGLHFVVVLKVSHSAHPHTYVACFVLCVSFSFLWCPSTMLFNSPSFSIVAVASCWCFPETCLSQRSQGKPYKFSQSIEQSPFAELSQRRWQFGCPNVWSTGHLEVLFTFLEQRCWVPSSCS
jgi:hypothetical protein